jgi:hypothetical protein
MTHEQRLKALSSWKSLNATLMALEDEAELEALLGVELRGERRPQFAMRIHCRFNKLRGARERFLILSITGVGGMGPYVERSPSLRALMREA